MAANSSALCQQASHDSEKSAGPSVPVTPKEKKEGKKSQAAGRGCLEEWLVF